MTVKTDGGGRLWLENASQWDSTIGLQYCVNLR